jgi:hypothetical protein
MIDQEFETRVEISGWDLSERFFVERGTLQQEEEKKKVTIHRPVRVGGLLFLRLLNNAHPSMSFPVAFRVREIRAETSTGDFEVTLRQMWPKPDANLPGPTPRVNATRPEWMGLK